MNKKIVGPKLIASTNFAIVIRMQRDSIK